MRRILNIALCVSLLCSCADSLDDPFTMAGVGSLLRPAQNYPLGASAVFGYSGGISFEDPMAHFYIFTPGDGNDYLIQLNVGALEATSYTVLLMTKPAAYTSITYIASHSSGNADRDWEMQCVVNPGHRARSGANSCASVHDLTNNDGGMGVENVLFALTFEYSGNPGVGDSTMNVWVIRAGSSTTQSSATAVGPVLDCTGKLAIAWKDTGGFDCFNGRQYFFAYYNHASGTYPIIQADLEGLFDGTLHPATDFSGLELYVDYSKPVDVTYAPEVGAEYVFDVVGTPVQGP